MKRKMFSLVLASLMILSLLCGCGKEADTFTVGFDAEFPPYGYQDANGEYTGCMFFQPSEPVCCKKPYSVWSPSPLRKVMGVPNFRRIRSISRRILTPPQKKSGLSDRA